jgi:hypothetical protein
VIKEANNPAALFATQDGGDAAMGVETIGSPRRRRDQPPGVPAEPADEVCALEPLAQVLAELLGHPVSAAEVRNRAVAFGLLRPPGSGADTELTAQNASRLLLAAYRLPAQAERAAWPDVHQHCREGRRVFLLLREAALQVHGLGSGDTGSWVLAAEPGAPAEAARKLPAEHLDAAGTLVIVAARGWGDLPTEGPAFFAGSRSRDGVFHWNAAECDTDADGRILRY